MSSLIPALLASIVASQTPATETPQLTLQEAMTLPPATLSVRVLGEVGSIYPEVQRPFVMGVPGATGFDLTFAGRPRATAYPGICEADTIAVYYWPVSDTAANELPKRVHSILFGKMYQLARGTTPCERSGPVLWDRNDIQTSAHFFAGYLRDGTAFTAAHAYFAVHAMQAMAASATKTGSSMRLSCRGEQASDGACANPRRLLATLAIGDTYGVDISRCENGGRELCVGFGLAAPTEGNPNRTLSVTLHTGRVDVDPVPADLSISRVAIEFQTVLS
jgi:hypothetical protein